MARTLSVALAFVLLACDAPPAAPDPDAGTDAAVPRDAGPLPEPLPACDVTPPATLLLRPGRQPDGSFVTIDGRLATAPGPRAVLEGFPSDVAVHPTLRVAYVVSASSDDRRLYAVDLDTQAILSDLPRDEVFYGLEVSPDGSALYLPGGDSGQLHVVTLGADGMLGATSTLELGGYLAGSALSPDGATLWVGDFAGDGIAEIDTATRTVRRRIALDASVWDLVHLAGRRELYASDLRGSGIAVVDLDTGTQAATIPVAVSPAGMTAEPDGSSVYVAMSGADAVVAIDTATRSMSASMIVGTSDLAGEGGAPLPNSNVNALWLDAARGRLYVSQGADNAVGVFEASTLARLGALPSDQYPTDVELAPDGDTLVVVSGRGDGAGPGGGAKDALRGTVAFVDLASIDLAAETARAASDFRRTGELYQPTCEAFPIPTAPGQVSPIERVILIVKENKTYDSILGDLDMADAERDPSLAEWGLPFTPNHHALALEFAHSDNFYVLTPNSDTGHLFLTATHMSEYAERVWLEDVRDGRFMTFPVDPLSSGGGRNFFTHLVDHGIETRIYGEIVGTSLRAADGTPISRLSDARYPGGPTTNYTVTDEDKARYVVSQIEAGRLAQFTYLLLPNDHGAGTRPGIPTPESMVADNDYAMGLVIEALSRSPYWPRSLVIVVEDDPQGTADHIEAHRSIIHVVSPWARRGYVSHVISSWRSIFATIERILGVPPMGRGDASSAPLYDMFTTTPDFTPYDARERTHPPEVNPEGAPGADASLRMDFRSPDREPHLGELVRAYRRWRRGEISHEEAESIIAALEEDEDGDVDESREEARAFDTEWERYRAWYWAEHRVALPELPLAPVRR